MLTFIVGEISHLEFQHSTSTVRRHYITSNLYIRYDQIPSIIESVETWILGVGESPGTEFYLGGDDGGTSGGEGAGCDADSKAVGGFY